MLRRSSSLSLAMLQLEEGRVSREADISRLRFRGASSISSISITDRFDMATSALWPTEVCGGYGCCHLWVIGVDGGIL
jgi:hypothetical protein